MEEIMEAVCWHVEQSGFKNVIRSGMVLTGGGSKIANLSNLADFVTGFETRLGSPNAFAIDPSSCEEAKDSTASTAVGMLIHAFQRMEDDGVFFPGCVTDINQQAIVAASPVDEYAEPVLAEAEDSSANAPSDKKGGRKFGIFKKLGKGLKSALDSETLFSSESNEV